MQTNGHSKETNELVMSIPTMPVGKNEPIVVSPKGKIDQRQKSAANHHRKTPAQRKTTKSPPATGNDVWIYRIVVSALGATVLLCVVVAFVTIYTKDTNAGALSLVTSLGSVALGALAGLLAPSPTSKG